MYSKIERLFKGKHVADKADWVKFKGSMKLWPVQTQHNKNHANNTQQTPNMTCFK